MSIQTGSFDLPICIHYRPSVMVFSGAVFAHAGALLCLPLIAISGLLKVLMALLIVCNSIMLYQQYRLGTRRSNPDQYILNSQDEWLLVPENDSSRKLFLMPGSLVHPVLVILRFKDAQRRLYTLILTMDNIDQDSLRRVRVRLRFRKEPN